MKIFRKELSRLEKIDKKLSILESYSVLPRIETLILLSQLPTQVSDSGRFTDNFYNKMYYLNGDPKRPFYLEQLRIRYEYSDKMPWYLEKSKLNKDEYDQLCTYYTSLVERCISLKQRMEEQYA